MAVRRLPQFEMLSQVFAAAGMAGRNACGAKVFQNYVQMRGGIPGDWSGSPTDQSQPFDRCLMLDRCIVYGSLDVYCFWGDTRQALYLDQSATNLLCLRMLVSNITLKARQS